MCTARIISLELIQIDDACALRMKGAKDSSIVIDISRDIIVNVEEIDDETLEEEEQEVPELESAVNVCF